jgi:hypothetical protein
MSGRQRYSRRALREAIYKSRGIKLNVAKTLGCSRQTVDNYLARWPDLQPVLDAQREELLDLAENKLVALINRGDVRSVIFALSTLGKERGYTTRSELTGKDGESLTLSPEVAALMARMNIPASAVIEELEALIRAQAAEVEDDERLETR